MMHTRRSAAPGGATLLGLVAIGLLALMGLMAYGMLRPGGRGGLATNDTGQLIPIKPRPAAEFSLPIFNGATVSLSEFRGRPVIVNFWASWCPPCRDEARALERSYQTYKDRAVFLGVNLWDNAAAAQNFMREYGVTYPNGPDARGALAVEYGVTGIPETYFIDKEGTLLHRWIGPLSEAELANILKDLL